MWARAALLCAAAALLLCAAAPGACAWPGGGGGGGGALCPRRVAGPGGTRYLAFLSRGPGPPALVESTWAGRGSLRACWARRDPRLARAFRAACARRPPAAPGAALRRDLAALWRRRAACRDPGGPGLGLGFGRRRRRRGWTVPGTLWCGAGDSAGSPGELGLFRGPDRCCREHDRCEAQIAALEFNYGIRNYRLHTVSHCDCDGRFRRCLLDLNDTISNIIGITFFNLLEVPCFVLEQSEECVQWHWWGGCERYGVVPLARMVQQNQYYYGLPMEEPGNPTMRSPRKGRRKSSRLGRKRLRQRLGQNPKLRQTQSPGQNQRLVTVQQPWGPGTLPPASTREEAEPTTRYLTAPWQLEPGPSTAMTMLEQDSAGGRQILGAAQQGGGGSAHPACMAHHEEDSIRSSPAAELHRATPVPPLDQRRQQGRMCRCYKRLDKCEHQIAPHEVKYELHNIDTRTLFHCNCTRRLARFLRRVRGLNDVEEAVLAERIAMDCFILEPLADCGLGKEPQDNCITVTQAVLVPAWHLRNTLRHWGPLHVTSKVKHQDQKIQDSGGTLYERCLQLFLEQKWGVQHHMAPR